MSKQLLILPEAQDDMRVALDWYEARSSGRGKKFVRAVEQCFRSIVRQPEFREIIRAGYRRATVRRYPYAVIYRFDPATDLVTVYSVFHCSQDPELLSNRLPPAD